jgi:predicted lipoprotein with Yx(FWY)xxD motif
MFRKSLGIAAAFAAMTVAACGGGGGTAGGGLAYGGPPTSPPAKSNVPQQQTIAGRPGFANPSNNRTLYFLDVDTPTGGTCTGGCLNIWPIIQPSSGSQNEGAFTIVTRSDGAGRQWSYKSHPLYMYSGDSGPDQSNGEGIPLAGGHWHVARPN